MADLDRILRFAVGENASDIHLKVDSPPMLRRYGTLAVEPSLPVLSAADLRSIVEQMADPPQIERLDRQRQVDLGYGTPDLGRFRVNVYHQRGELRIAFRWIPTRIRSLADLGMPASVSTVATGSRGLILVTGTTGSGKSTTLAAMIDKINTDKPHHIITVEDPIEFLHPHKLGIVNQREIGSDTAGFKTALRYVLRQDPDVVLIGELRDLETVEAALSIAETGHLCLATLHTNGAIQTVNRVIDVFPPHQQDQVRAQLSFVLEGIVSQQLIPRSTGQGRCMALEVLVMTPAIRNLIRDNKMHQMYSQMQVGQQKYGMQTMNQALFSLLQRRLITIDEAISRSTDIDELRTMLKGSA